MDLGEEFGGESAGKSGGNHEKGELGSLPAGIRMQLEKLNSKRLQFQLETTFKYLEKVKPDLYRQLQRFVKEKIRQEERKKSQK